MRRERVYVDFDDVLCETAEAAADLASRRFGRTVPFEQLFSFDLRTSFRLTDAQAGELLQALHAEDALAGFRPIPGAIPALQQWARQGAAICVVTGRPPATRDASRGWLTRHEVPYEDIIHVDKYGRGHANTPDVASMALDDLAGQEFSLAIEDSAEMVAFLATRTRTPVVLLERPWNRRARLPPRADARGPYRCRGWHEILRRFPSPRPAD